MADKIYEDDELVSVRFFCDCGDQGHNLEVVIERNKQGDILQCSFNLFLAGRPDLRWRIKEAFSCLKGKDGQLGDFVLDKKDYQAMIDIIHQLNPHFSSTSGTGNLR